MKCSNMMERIGYLPVENIPKEFGSGPELSIDERRIVAGELERNEDVLVDAGFKLLDDRLFETLQNGRLDSQRRMVVHQRFHQLHQPIGLADGTRIIRRFHHLQTIKIIVKLYVIHPWASWRKNY